MQTEVLQSAISPIVWSWIAPLFLTSMQLNDYAINLIFSRA